MESPHMCIIYFKKNSLQLFLPSSLPGKAATHTLLLMLLHTPVNELQC